MPHGHDNQSTNDHHCGQVVAGKHSNNLCLCMSVCTVAPWTAAVARVLALAEAPGVGVAMALPVEVARAPPSSTLVAAMRETFLIPASNKPTHAAAMPMHLVVLSAVAWAVGPPWAVGPHGGLPVEVAAAATDGRPVVLLEAAGLPLAHVAAVLAVALQAAQVAAAVAVAEVVLAAVTSDMWSRE